MAAQDLNNLIKKTKALNLRDKVIRGALQNVHVMTDKRIFRQGRDAFDKSLGRYSKGYQKTRNAGILYVRKGVKIKITYPSGTKVILQATSQMVNDYKLLVLPGGNFGSGFSNDVNFDKSFWVEDTYDKPIFQLTDKEDKQLEIILEQKLSKFYSKL